MSMQHIKLPELGEGVTEGELLKWQVSVGDKVKTDQVLAEVMTDKASMEVPSPYDGIVESLQAQPGDRIKVGQNLLSLKSSGNTQTLSSGKKSKDIPTSVSRNTHQRQQQTASIKKHKETHLPTEIITSEETHQFVQPLKKGLSPLALPHTRRLAKEWKIDLSQIKGTGLAGRITKADLLKHKGNRSIPFATQSSSMTQKQAGFMVPKAPGQERQPLKGIRKIIADKMSMSKTVIPHFTLLESAQVEKLFSLRASVKEKLEPESIKVTYLSFVLKALLQTVQKFPQLNASIDDHSQEVVIKKYYHFGFATDTPRGLLVPVIKNIDQKTLKEISQEIQDLAHKARTGNIRPEEMKDGTVTVTNIGSLGGQYATPVINPPESVILGMYRLFVAPVWQEKEQCFQPVKTMNFSLTCDHRLIDGALSAKALQFFIQLLEEPIGLFI